MNFMRSRNAAKIRSITADRVTMNGLIKTKTMTPNVISLMSKCVLTVYCYLITKMLLLKSLRAFLSSFIDC